jgi:hypothetical protein
MVLVSPTALTRPNWEPRSGLGPCRRNTRWQGITAAWRARPAGLEPATFGSVAGYRRLTGVDRPLPLETEIER